MNSIEIATGKRIYKRQLPSSWDELTRRQLLMVCRMRNRKLNAEQLLQGIVFRLLRIPMAVFQRMKVHQFSDLLERFSFLFTSDFEMGKFVINAYTYNWFTAFVTGGLCGRYYGPGDDMKWTTVAEMAVADSYFRATSSELQVAGVIAALYRPMSLRGLWRKWAYGGDIREAFNDQTVLRRAKRIMFWPKEVKDAILIQYAGSRAKSVRLNEELYDNRVDGGYGWAGLIINLAGPEIGTIEQVEKLLWSNALVFMKKLDMDRRRLEGKSGSGREYAGK